MGSELLIGVLVLLGILWMQPREGMATGIFDSSGGKLPTAAEVPEIFDQIISMAPAILQRAYAEALVLARAALADARTLSAKYPEDTMLATQLAEMTDDKLVLLAKTGIVDVFLVTGNQIKQQSGVVNAETAHSVIDPLYEQLNQHIDDAAPPVNPNATAEQRDIQSKGLEYAGQARALVRKYKTPEVRDAIVTTLKTYYGTQRTPTLSCPTGLEAGPTSCHLKCPSGFAYSNSGGIEQCVSDRNPMYTVSLTALPVSASPPQITAEQTRFSTAYRALQTRIGEDDAAHATAVAAGADATRIDAQVDSVGKMHQSSRLLRQTSDMIDDVMNMTGKPRTPPEGTPDSKSMKNRQEILKIQAMHLYVIQAALFTLLMCILAYFVLPAEVAHLVVILILATGIASAIYLSKL